MYKYAEIKPCLFTEQGMRIMIDMRDKIKIALKQHGAFKASKVMTSGDTWTMLAVLDYLVELGEIREIKRSCAGQDRVFIENGT